MNTITIYSTPSCTKCNATKNKFDALGLEYQEILFEDDPEALARFKKMEESEELFESYAQEFHEQLLLIKNKLELTDEKIGFFQ